MREDNSNWFAKWEEELPSPEDLMPLSQSLITPDLAMAFDIPNPNNSHHHHQPLLPPPPPPAVQTSSSLPKSNSSEFDSADLGSGSDDPARALKRPRLVWTPQLHKRFVDAVAHLGIKNAVPKTIMQLMSVDGLTRENVASHLQKYRLYLKRMQGLPSGGAGGGGGAGSAGFPATGDPTTDHLFASSPVPTHFLHPCKPNSNNFMQFMPPPVSKLQQSQPQSHPHPHQLQPQQQYRQMGHFGSPQFEYSFMNNNNNNNNNRVGMGAPLHTSVLVPSSSSSCIDDEMESLAHGRKKVLTLFPPGDH